VRRICGPRFGWRGWSSRSVEFSIIRVMSGSCCGSGGGVASSQRGGPWNGTRRPFGAGRRLKKSLKKAANPRFHRRKRIKRAAAPLPDVGAARPDAGVAIPLLLEDALGDGRGDVVELPSSALAGSDPQLAGRGVSGALAVTPGRPAADCVGRLPSHRSRPVWNYGREQRGRIWLEFLPAHAPEPNPVEYLWSHWKPHELPNPCPYNFWKLRHHARRALRRMRRRPARVMAFWEPAELFSW
jgi:hypothetical protein